MYELRQGKLPCPQCLGVMNHQQYSADTELRNPEGDQYHHWHFYIALPLTADGWWWWNHHGSGIASLFFIQPLSSAQLCIWWHLHCLSKCVQSNTLYLRRVGQTGRKMIYGSSRWFSMHCPWTSQGICYSCQAQSQTEKGQTWGRNRFPWFLAVDKLHVLK